MGIYIKGVEMPKDGEHPIWVSLHSDGIVEYNANKGEGWQMTTAVLVPEHGRLIDADVLIDAIITKYIRHERNRELVFAAVEIKQDLADIINEMPTIIPAEEVYNG